MSASKHRFHVRGTNEEGEIWTFSTNDRERAEDMLEQMKEDLADAELLDREP